MPPTDPGRARRRGGCGRGIAWLVLLVAGAVAFAMTSVNGTGHVVRKRETIRVLSAGDWVREWDLVVRLPAATSGLEPVVAVDSARFARTRVGDPIVLRFPACCTLFSRVADRSLAEASLDYARLVVVGLRWALWMVLGIAAIVAAARTGRRALVLVTAVAWAAAGLALDALSPDAPPVRAGTRESVAIARDVARESWVVHGSRSGPAFRLPVPYQIATLAFLPANAADTVVAVDVVDSGSVHGLATGTRVPIRYDPSAPREAQLVGATRTYAEEDAPLVRAVAGGFVALVTVLALIAGGRPRRRR